MKITKEVKCDFGISNLRGTLHNIKKSFSEELENCYSKLVRAYSIKEEEIRDVYFCSEGEEEDYYPLKMCIRYYETPSEEQIKAIEKRRKEYEAAQYQQFLKLKEKYENLQKIS